MDLDNFWSWNLDENFTDLSVLSQPQWATCWYALSLIAQRKHPPTSNE